MKILMVSAEAVPFAKSGGLADMVSALALALHKRGNDVRIVMPRYYGIDPGTLTPVEGPMAVPLGAGGEAWTAVYRADMNGVGVYFIDHQACFGRDGIYGSGSESDFHDNPVRFSLLCNGAFQLCRKLDWYPDIIHAHDWSAALAPAILHYRERWFGFGSTAGVFTIHNMGYQGNYSKDYFPYLALDWQYFHGAGFEDHDRINFLKAGIFSSEMITTVSPTYAREVRSYEGGWGLDGLLNIRADALRGILNGVDTEVWNPAADRLLSQTYDAATVAAGKKANKRALQKAMGLEVRDDVPVVGMITRLADQKGIADVFAPTYGCLYRLCSQNDVQFVLLGSGEQWCVDEVNSLQGKLGNFRAKIGYSESLSHLIEAGSDLFLMPSKYEPCGLNQMYSLLYGTLPIVRRTGGLADTVVQYDDTPNAQTGTGFVFDYLSPDAVHDTIVWALYVWKHKPKAFAAMQQRAMAQNFTWDRAGIAYEEVYTEALSRIGTQPKVARGKTAAVKPGPKPKAAAEKKTAPRAKAKTAAKLKAGETAAAKPPRAKPGPKPKAAAEKKTAPRAKAKTAAAPKTGRGRKKSDPKP